MTLKKLTYISIFFTLFTHLSTSAQPVFRWADALWGFNTAITTNQNQATSMFVNKKSDVYVIGVFQRMIDMDPGAGVDSIYDPVAANPGYLGKYDSSGHLIWAHTFGDGSGVTSVIDDSGNYYIAGQAAGLDSFGLGFSVDTSTFQGFWVAKYNSSDHLVWVRVTAAPDGDIFGVKVDHAGSVYVTGQFNGPTDFDPAHPGTVVFTPSVLDGFVAKYDLNGNFVWARQIHGGDGDRGVALDLDPSGNLFVTGYTGGTGGPTTPVGDTGGVYRTLNLNGNYDGFLIKYTPDGAVMWMRAIGGYGNDFGTGVLADRMGNAYAFGNYTTSMIADTASHDTLHVGAPGSNNVGGYLIKFGPSGNFIWARNYGCDSSFNLYANITGLAKDDTDNIYVTGTFMGRITLNPEAPPVYAQGGVTGLGEDYYVLKLDSAGHYKWHMHTWSNRDDQTGCITLDAANNIYIGGYITETTNFNPYGGGGTVTVAVPNPNWVPVTFFAKYQQAKPWTDTITQVSAVEGRTYTLFPNPVTSQLTLTGATTSAKVSVCDILGKTYQLPVTTQSGAFIISTGTLAPGIYIIQCSEPNITPFRAKFIKE